MNPLMLLFLIVSTLCAVAIHFYCIGKDEGIREMAQDALDMLRAKARENDWTKRGVLNLANDLEKDFRECGMLPLKGRVQK